MNGLKVRKSAVGNKLAQTGAINHAAKQVIADMQAQNIKDQVTPRRGIDIFTVNIVSTDAADQTIALFDPQGVCNDVTAGTYDFQQGGSTIAVTVSGGTLYSALEANVATNPIYIAGYQLQASNSLQFNRGFTWFEGLVGQTSNGKSMASEITAAQNAGYFQGNILPIQDARCIDSNTALVLTIGSGYTLSITFAAVKQA